MSRRKVKFIWIVQAQGRLVAAFDSEDAADTYCMLANGDDRARAEEQSKFGLKRGRTYYTWQALTVQASPEGSIE